MLDVKPLTSKTLADLEQLFSSDNSAKSCWCMWFIIAVKELHQGGSPANEAKFKALAENSAHPLGLRPDMRGQKIARSLLERAVEVARVPPACRIGYPPPISR